MLFLKITIEKPHRAEKSDEGGNDDAENFQDQQRVPVFNPAPGVQVGGFFPGE
jgi:hypothetical protein